MVEKIIINPESVRGLGNIVSPKSTSDFVLSNAEISSASETVNGMNLTVYHLQLSSLGILSVSVSTQSVTVGAAVTVTATIVDRLGTPIPDVPVTISCGSYSFDATDTNSSGQVTKSYTTTASDVGNMTVKAESSGYTTATTYVSVNKHVSDLSMSIADSSVDVGQTFALSGVLKIDDVGTSGLGVDIYQDGTVIDTVTTGSGGAWSKSVYAVTVGTTVFKAVYQGSNVNASDETSEYTCTVSLNPTNLNITVPAIVYSDEFDVTGVLTDNSNNPISNASVKLKWMVGGLLYESSPETTNSSGQVTFHRSAPTSITTYTFWVEFNGTSVYGQSNSSAVNRTVGKETTVLSVSSPSNNASFDSGDSVTVAGTLLTNDSEKLPSGTSITIKEGTTTLGTASVSTSDGSFSTTISGLSDGSHTLTIAYEESTNYLGSSVTRTVIMASSASVSTLTLISDKSILSYVDSESATLTATALTGSNVGVADKMVYFYESTGGVTSYTQTSSTPLELGDEWCIFIDTNNTTASSYINITDENSTLVFVYAPGYGGGVLRYNGNVVTTFSGGDDVLTYKDGVLSSGTGTLDVTSYNVDLTEISYVKINTSDIWMNVVTDYVGSDKTDSNGEASVTYQSEHQGNINIKATCNNVESSTVAIEDYYLDDSLTVDKSRYSVTQGTGTISYSSNGISITGTANVDVIISNSSYTLPNKYTAEITVTGFSSSWSSGIVFEDLILTNVSNENKSVTFRESTNSQIGSNLPKLTVGTIVKLEYDASTTTMKIYYDDVLQATFNDITATHNHHFRSYNGRNLVVKNLKIKSL